MCYVFKFLRKYTVQSFSCDVRHYPSRLAPSSTTGTLFILFYFFVFCFLITRTIKQGDLAAAFSATSLTELEQKYSSGLGVENNMSLFAEIPKYFYFV